MIKKLVSCGIALLFLFGVGFFINNSTDIFAKTDVPTESIKDSKRITKEEIHNKMLNSIDNFKTATGSFEYHSNIFNEDQIINYQVELGSVPKSYSKINDKLNKINKENVFDGENIFFINNNDKKYVQNKKREAGPDLKDKSAKARYRKDSKGEKLYLYRNDPTYMREVSISLFPQQIATGFLEDYTKWDIVSETTLNGLDAVVIEGKLNDYYKSKIGSEKFIFWVHKNTGILLKLEEYDSDGNITESLNTLDISIDGKKDDAKFKVKIPNEYKEINTTVK